MFFKVITLSILLTSLTCPSPACNGCAYRTRSLEVAFPEPFATFHNKIVSITGFSLVEMLPLNCYVKYSHHNHLLVMTLTPIALVIFSLAAASSEACRHKQSLDHGHESIDKSGLRVAAAFMVLFLSLPVSSTTILRTFHCLRFEDGTGSYLHADLYINCESKMNKQMQVFAGFMLIVFPIGTPLFYFLALYRVREKINPQSISSEFAAYAKRAADASLAPLRPLFSMYRPAFWYFESIDVVRRITMCDCGWRRPITSLTPMVRTPSFRARRTNARSRPRYRRANRSKGRCLGVKEPCRWASDSSMVPRTCLRRPSTPRTYVPVRCARRARRETRRRRQQSHLSGKSY